MGEVVVSSEEVEVTSCREGEKREIQMKMTKEGEELMKDETRRDGLVKWEKFLPKISLRILLVEADDSTRQIVAALLRKCSYKVAAVADGLKAWEILKGRPHNIDLILTEVDLPLISGYALLTLIMEHEICKNIPVIMMSSQDSVSTVYKCMLRGAADYLVKPLRRNELRNLWQHVWRRQSSLTGTSSRRGESVGQQKLEATSENNSANNRSCGFEDCINRDKEQNEKETDAQSSCTKPDAEAESDDMESTLDWLQKKQGKSLEDDVNLQKQKELAGYCKRLPVDQGNMRALPTCDDTDMATATEEVKAENQGDGSITRAASNVPENSSKEAFDFMGTFRAHCFASKDGMSRFDSQVELDLSLRRPHSSGFENHTVEERPLLRQSNVSAFTRYIGRPIRTQCSFSPGLTDQNKDMGSDNRKRLSDIAGYSANAPGPPPPPHLQRSITCLTTGRSDEQGKQPEVDLSWQQQGSFPLPIPVKGIRVNNSNRGDGSGLPQMLVTQSSLSPIASPSTISPQEFSSRLQPFYLSSYESSKSEQLYDCLVYNTDSKLDSSEERACSFPTAEQGSPLCNGSLTQLNNMGYCSASGSNSNPDAENKCDNGFVATLTTGNSQRSLQREAALTKFRMKRKDRCFEKKVRYESRKKLAEQRPRVKGQFVRQKTDPPAQNCDTL